MYAEFLTTVYALTYCTPHAYAHTWKLIMNDISDSVLQLMSLPVQSSLTWRDPLYFTPVFSHLPLTPLLTLSSTPPPLKHLPNVPLHLNYGWPEKCGSEFWRLIYETSHLRGSHKRQRERRENCWEGRGGRTKQRSRCTQHVWALFDLSSRSFSLVCHGLCLWRLCVSKGGIPLTHKEYFSQLFLNSV